MKNTVYILTLFLLIFFSSKLKACTCIETSIKYEVMNKEAIIAGTIIQEEEITIYDTLSPNRILSRIEMKFTVEIDNIYKGQFNSDTVFVYTGSGGGDCGYRFKLGEKYIIYAGSLNPYVRYDGQIVNDSNIAFYTTICSRTRLFKYAEIKELKKQLKRHRRRNKN